MRHYHMTDSYSDGMCGWVLVEHTDGEVAKVHWSVTGEIRSQEHARQDAIRIILAERLESALDGPLQARTDLLREALAYTELTRRRYAVEVAR